ncbi:hypothetical protein [Serratia sp. CY83965]|uniref:hypothetical protein n=1 Tax=Serratia sp. CY83965 TaxID=3383693 RepID=UPI003FA0A2BB
MDNKLSELSKPVAWTDERGNLCTNRNKERGLESRYHQDYEKYTTPFYSQEYVSALKHESAVNWEAAASLNVENQELKKRIAELEAKLDTPVRLPPADSQGRYHGMMTRFAIKKAGFTVEGDE